MRMRKLVPVAAIVVVIAHLTGCCPCLYCIPYDPNVSTRDLEPPAELPAPVQAASNVAQAH